MKILQPGISDHSPLIIFVPVNVIHRKKPFRFYNMWCSHPQFKQIVASVWRTPISGCAMYKVVQKLKLLKADLKLLNKREFSDIVNRVDNARETLLRFHSSLQNDPLNHQLLLEERTAYSQYVYWLRQEESFFK